MKINPNAQLKIQLGSDGNPKIYACAHRWNKRLFAPHWSRESVWTAKTQQRQSSTS